MKKEKKKNLIKKVKIVNWFVRCNFLYTNKKGGITDYMNKEKLLESLVCCNFFIKNPTRIKRKSFILTLCHSRLF